MIQNMFRSVMRRYVFFKVRLKYGYSMSHPRSLNIGHYTCSDTRASLSVAIEIAQDDHLIKIKRSSNWYNAKLREMVL